MDDGLLEWTASRRACNQSVSGLEEFPDTHNCVLAFSLLDESWTPYHVTVYGYIHPLVVVITMVTNCLVCAVLLKRTMRSPTSTLLVAMAVSDTMTGVLPTPYFISFYMFGLYHDWVPYNWCLPYLYFTDHLPTIFHTASVWLTVALAAQRYIHVCHGGTAKRLCTVSNMLRVIAVVYFLAALSQLPRLLETRVGHVRVTSLVEPEMEIDGCYVDYVPVVLNHMKLYFSLYFWARVVLTHLIPCTSLVALNAALAHTMTIARRRRNMLLIRPGNGPGNGRECRRIDDSIATTLMLVAVVGLLLLVELPLAVFLILLILENTWNYPLMPDGTPGTASLFINLFIVLSYPVNFFIYCGMSRQFRRTFAQLLRPGLSTTSPAATINQCPVDLPSVLSPSLLLSPSVLSVGRRSPSKATSSLFSRLRRSAVGSVQPAQHPLCTQQVSFGLQTVSANAAVTTDDRQLDDSCHL